MDEAHFEHAERITQAAREAAVAKAHRLTSGSGQADCEDCGEPIAAARRVALPCAIRCFHCQTAHEAARAQFNPAL